LTDGGGISSLACPSFLLLRDLHTGFTKVYENSESALLMVKRHASRLATVWCNNFWPIRLLVTLQKLLMHPVNTLMLTTWCRVAWLKVTQNNSF